MFWFSINRTSILLLCGMWIFDSSSPLHLTGLPGAVPPSTICSRHSHNPPQHHGSHLGQHPPICSACSQSNESKRLGYEGGTERAKETSLIVAALRLTRHLNPLALLSQRALKPLFTRRILAVTAYWQGTAIEPRKNSIPSVSPGLLVYFPRSFLLCLP